MKIEAIHKRIFRHAAESLLRGDSAFCCSAIYSALHRGIATEDEIDEAEHIFKSFFDQRRVLYWIFDDLTPTMEDLTNCRVLALLFLLEQTHTPETAQKSCLI